eukprot:g4349.t1
MTVRETKGNFPASSLVARILLILGLLPGATLHMRRLQEDPRARCNIFEPSVSVGKFELALAPSREGVLRQRGQIGS